jgi:signal transduction protein with GAF and PtsI domain
MSETDIVLGQIKQALDQLGAEISKGKYSAALLADLKSSVDQLRLTMWAVIEAEHQRKQEIRGDRMGLRKKLAEFRIKRIMQMLSDLRVDAADPESSDLQALKTALGMIGQEVDDMIARRSNQPSPLGRKG